jgi:HSP20 family molecular chaperone IbpA
MTTEIRKNETDNRRALTPRVDVFENNDEILLIADLPGLAKETLDLKLEANLLQIEGTVPPDSDGFHNGFVYRRAFELPNGIDADKVQAELAQGVLTLHVPKSAAKRTRTISIKSA